MDDNNWINELIAYISRFDSEYGVAIKAARESEISALEDVIGERLPAAHRAYLMHLGDSDGGLLNRLRADSRARTVTTYCQDLREDIPDIKFERCIPFATGDVFEGIGLWVEQDSVNPPVVFLNDGLPGDILCGNLPSFLYQRAFLYERATLALTAHYENFNSEITIDAIKSTLADIGYLEEWFSDARLYCGRKENSLLLAYAGAPNNGLKIEISCNSEITAFEEGDRILEKTGTGSLRRVVKEPTLPEVRARGGVRVRVIRDIDI
ncbi:SMI1/KNR4 family protein [Burkholderia arboris]|uniref:hypothetical protein n=1 Tax=Burkholderia arboris TaxID=488730 RepID=UPI0004D3E0DA|nr:hypothetical protein [Burkholderia arboris]MCA8495560.1 hypothetical protein [Burkholderia arboris]